MIDVIDYRAGNAPSVAYALERLGIACRLTAEPDRLARAGRIVLPGVGAAGATVDSLRTSGLLEPLERRVRVDGVPFLGICIGLQVLFDHSDEGGVDGLGWLPGRVRRFGTGVRVPQIGWNRVVPVRPHPVLRGLPEPAYCYFVNSYHAVPDERADVLAETEYGVTFCSVAGRDNLVATQFHAEKSGEVGLRLLADFASWEP